VHDAAEARATGGDLIVEHPLADAESQRSVVDAVRGGGRQPRIVECRTADNLHAAIAPDVPTRHRIVVDPAGDAEDLLDQVSAWLDAALRDLAPRAVTREPPAAS
jgi:hypothetical protein